MSNKNILHINGKAFDATTGKRIDHLAASNTKQAAHSRPETAVHHDIIAAPDSHRQPAHTAHVLHKKSIKGKTLRRELVKKPSTVAERKKTTSPHLVAPNHPLFAPSVHQEERLSKADQQRLARATGIAQSHQISRFGTSSDGIKKTHAHLPVAKAPAHSQHIQAVAAPITSTIADVAVPQTQQLPTAHFAPSHHVEHKPKLRHIVAHKLDIRSKTRPLVTAGVTALLLTGFFAYQHIPLVALQVAERSAGIDAKLPRSIAGYNMNGPIQYRSGQITISFKSNSDDRSYTISQQSSSWNSEALKSNFVALSDSPFDTVLDRGRTIYLYGSGNATWVDGGIWYNLEGNENLSPDQILGLTASL